jgi:hypothetical protein
MVMLASIEQGQKDQLRDLRPWGSDWEEGKSKAEAERDRQRNSEIVSNVMGQDDEEEA